jgi:hypothetical protein
VRKKWSNKMPSSRCDVLAHAISVSGLKWVGRVWVLIMYVLVARIS